MRGPVGVFAAVVFVLLTASPVLAAGQFDGIWSGQLLNPDFCPESGDCPQFFSIHQNDAFLANRDLLPNGFNVVVVLLDGFGTWTFVLGTLTGSTLQGVAFDIDFSQIGTFSMTVTPTTLTGQTELFGTQYSVSGVKIF